MVSSTTSIEALMHERLSKRLSKEVAESNGSSSAAIDPQLITTLITTIFSVIANCRNRDTPTDETAETQVARMDKMSDRAKERIFRTQLIRDEYDGRRKAWRKDNGHEQVTAAMAEYKGLSQTEKLELVQTARSEQELIDIS